MSTRDRSPAVTLLLGVALALTSCGASIGSPDAAPAGDPIEVSTLDGDDCSDDTVDADFPDVVGARLEPAGDGTGAYRVAVTLCSRYDTTARYADAWRVVTPGGEVLGTRELLHDHAGEQPFTRSLNGTITVPDDVTALVVEARDLANGWGGTALTVPLDG